MLNFAIIGLGGLGKVHLKNMVELQKTRKDIKLVALCDIEESRFYEEVKTNLGGDQTPVDLSHYHLYTDVDKLLEEEELDFVITALPTYLHAEFAIKLLEKGIHVFSEKPMALNLEECSKMAEASQKQDRQLMIGHCLRFWPVYAKLKELVDEKPYGKMIRAEFFRYSPTPVWSWQNWLLDEEKSGGAALDMHVHDVDFIQWTFGMPKGVTSFATHIKSRYDSIFTTYDYDDFLITSACDWGLPSSYPFNHYYLVRFEHATVKMDGKQITLYPEQGEPSVIEVSGSDAYLTEIDHFVDGILQGKSSTVSTIQSVTDTIALARAEMKSAEEGRYISL